MSRRGLLCLSIFRNRWQWSQRNQQISALLIGSLQHYRANRLFVLSYHCHRPIHVRGNRKSPVCSGLCRTDDTKRVHREQAEHRPLRMNPYCCSAYGPSTRLHHCFALKGDFRWIVQIYDAAAESKSAEHRNRSN